MKLAEQKPVNVLPKDRAGRHAATHHDGQRHEDAAPLPHEADQHPDSQQEDGTREVGRQAHADLARGLTDTDRRGGDAYQQRTQNDANTRGEAPQHKRARKH